MNRIDKKFQDLRKRKKKAFIAFITAGYPDLNTTKKLVLEMDNLGVSIVELGVPFSDPLADGPTIQAASELALKRGANLYKILGLVKSIRRQSQIPLCLMTYYNPIFRFGHEKFILAAKKAGVDAVIIPDLPPEEAKDFMRHAKKQNIFSILFLSPTSSKERIKMVSKLASGFIYYVSLTGVTGTRQTIAKDLVKNIGLIKRYTDKPVCVGFGISRPEHVRNISRTADGAIVGSAIVREIAKNINGKDLVKKVSILVNSLIKPLR